MLSSISWAPQLLDSLERRRAIELLCGYGRSRQTGYDKVKSLDPSIKQSSTLAIFYYAGLSMRERDMAVIRLILFVCGTVAAAAVFRLFGLLLLLPIVSVLAYWRIAALAHRRAERFERDYPAFLLSLASAVRTGLDPLAALLSARVLFDADSEISCELRKVELAVEGGASEQEALAIFGRSILHPDISLFRTAFLLARRQGSSLAECLHRLARVTRQRQSFRRKMRAAVAMQKLSAFGIAACTLVIGLIQVATNPDAVVEALNHPLGRKILVFGGCLVVVGVGWMLRLTRSRS